MLSFPYPTCNSSNYVNAKEVKQSYAEKYKKKYKQNKQTSYMSQLNHRMNASEKLEDHRRNSSRNECKKSKISAVQYRGFLLKSKHKPLAASAMRGTDTLSC